MLRSINLLVSVIFGGSSFDCLFPSILLHCTEPTAPSINWLNRDGVVDGLGNGACVLRNRSPGTITGGTGRPGSEPPFH